MRKSILWMTLLFLCVATTAWADTIILHDGASYSGRFTGAPSGQITFTDGQGIEYRFPIGDVQSIVFTPTTDIVSLRSGKVYSGKYTGGSPIGFTDQGGIQYQFPMSDVASLVLTRKQPAPVPSNGGETKIIPNYTDITIRTAVDIDSQDSSTGQLYAATIANDVTDTAGNIAIPAGSSAKLVVREFKSGGMFHSPEIVLDLFSVTVGGKEYRVVTGDVDINNKSGVGANKRTAEFGGGGAAIGALMGGIFGGGKGAGIGAAAGAGGGLLTQVFTRGKQIKVPAESSLQFRLDQTLVLRHQD